MNCAIANFIEGIRRLRFLKLGAQLFEYRQYSQLCLYIISVAWEARQLFICLLEARLNLIVIIDLNAPTVNGITNFD